jgi:hypothetical protein
MATPERIDTTAAYAGRERRARRRGDRPRDRLPLVAAPDGRARDPALAAVSPGCRTIEQLTAHASAAGLELVSEAHPRAAREAPRAAAG